MVTLAQALRRARQTLAGAGVPDASFDAVQLVRFATGRDPRLACGEELNPAQAARLESLLVRRCAREPLQYLLGSWDFMDLTLAVGPGVLIPRADTELAAGLAIDAARRACAHTPHPAAADLCAGSGAIGLALARHVPAARVTAVELSPEALCYLRRNNDAYGAPLHIVCADVLTWQPGECAWDVIVCNPPYVTEREYAALEPELFAEPKMALTAPEEGLLFYRVLTRSLRNALRGGGRLIFEIGAAQGQAVCGLCRAAGFGDVRLYKDAAGLPRAVEACAPGV